jgi:PEGA domain-containing protein
MAKSDVVWLGPTQLDRGHPVVPTLGGSGMRLAEARKARRWPPIAALVVGISAFPAAGVSMLVACTHGIKETDPQRAIASTSAAATPASEPIVVSIDALPSGAKIFLDGVALATNPYEAEHPRDERSHVIRVEAPGYEPQSPSVAFSRSVHTHVDLVPLGGSAQPAAHGPPARPAATPSASAPPHPG